MKNILLGFFHFIYPILDEQGAIGVWPLYGVIHDDRRRYPKATATNQR